MDNYRTRSDIQTAELKSVHEMAYRLQLLPSPSPQQPHYQLSLGQTTAGMQTLWSFQSGLTELFLLSPTNHVVTLR